MKLLDDENRSVGMADQVAGNSSACGETLFPVPLPLTHEHQIHMVVIGDSQQTRSGVTVENVDGDVESLCFELGFVRFQLFDGLGTDGFEQIVVSFGIDG